MGLNNLQEFIEGQCQQACKPVDLIVAARSFGLHARATQRRGSHQFRLVVDAESCLHKLYGGYFSDWACGGQWSHMLAFLGNLVQTCRSSNIELTMFFNGALESQHMDEWYREQAECYSRVQSIVRHIHLKATPPPKIWWLPPPMTATCLRHALRQLGVTVSCSMDDHHQEVIAYCRENDLNGVLAQDCDYAIFNPPRYFSAHHLKLTFKGSLDTQEYIIDDLAKAIDLHPNRFCILAALLGTHILPEVDLRQFYCRICHLSSVAQLIQYPSSEVVRAVIAFVRSLASTDDLDVIGANVFSSSLDVVKTDRVNRFKQSVQYYVNGTQDGFFRYRPKTQLSPPVKQPGSYPSDTGNSKREKISIAVEQQIVKTSAALEQCSLEEKMFSTSADANFLDSPQSTSTSGYGSSMLLHVDGAAMLARRLTGINLNDGDSEANGKQASPKAKSVKFSSEVETLSSESTGQAKKLLSSQFTNEQNGPKLVGSNDTAIGGTTMAAANSNKPPSLLSLGVMKVDGALHNISPEVMQIASERHQKGLMYPWVYQLLSQGEIKLPVSLEDETNMELPSAVDVYRPLRQRLYGVLFDLSERTTQWKLNQGTMDQRPKISIKEWVFPRGGIANGRLYCDVVWAEPLEWPVPGLQRLWIGMSTEDKSYRLKTFLSCMRCDSPQNLLLNTSYVPQQLMLFCCVLRYILTYNQVRILRPFELDVLLATAISPYIQQQDVGQELELTEVRMRGVQLATLIMTGLEHAVFANDAVGAPVPWGVACPWHFFNGKLFHMNLLQAVNHASLLDICDGDPDRVLCVERMRTAILNGMKPHTMFAYPPVRPLMDWRPPQELLPPFHMNMEPLMFPHNHGGGLGDRSTYITDSRGGTLEIAGVVVGSWGANTAAAHCAPPHITSVGPHRSNGSVSILANGGRVRYNRTPLKRKKKDSLGPGNARASSSCDKIKTSNINNNNKTTPVIHLIKNTDHSMTAESTMVSQPIKREQPNNSTNQEAELLLGNKVDRTVHHDNGRETSRVAARFDLSPNVPNPSLDKSSPRPNTTACCDTFESKPL